jgi:FAD:protein FMN transferase
MALLVWVVIALQSLAGAHAPGATPARVEREAWVMGTRLRIVAEGSTRAGAQASAERSLRAIERVDRLLSTWDSATALSRINRSRTGRAVHPGAQLGSLLRETEQWARRTGRAFDPTIGALVDAWGLRTGGAAPDAHELASALAASGPNAILIEGEGGPDPSMEAPVTVLRAAEGAWIDSGGFGKGAALRAVVALRRGDADTRLLVDLGGQLLLIAPPDAPFVVEVAHPRARHAGVATLSVSRGSVATSGASERPGHLLDPRTGRPVDAWGSVTVVAEDPLRADVLSTALYVMGAERGHAWAERNGTAALFLELHGEEVSARWTSAMERSLLEAPLVSPPPSHSTKGPS